MFRPSIVPIVAAALVLIACAKREAAMSDSTPAAPAPATTPASLTPADVAGTWTGTTMLADRDSVVARWTAHATSDSTGAVTVTASKQTVPYHFTLDADSMISISEPYVDAVRKGPKIWFRTVAHVRDGKLTGTMYTMLAAKPDSVVRQTRIEATRAP